jgi:phosphoglucosamine mutase
VRASGTERIIRVMAEGPEQNEVEQIVDRVATVVREKMGSAPAGVAVDEDDE